MDADDMTRVQTISDPHERAREAGAAHREPRVMAGSRHELAHGVCAEVVAAQAQGH